MAKRTRMIRVSEIFAKKLKLLSKKKNKSIVKLTEEIEIDYSPLDIISLDFSKRKKRLSP